MGGRLVVTVRKAVVTWCRLHAAVRLPERAAVMAKKMGVPVQLVLIRDQRRRCRQAVFVRRRLVSREDGLNE